MGDFNAWHKDWGNESNNPRGEKLKQIINENNVYINRTNFPTRLNDSFKGHDSYLDFYITDSPDTIGKDF